LKSREIAELNNNLQIIDEKLSNQTISEKRRNERSWECEKECLKFKNEYNKLLNEYEEFKNKHIEVSRYNINTKTFKSDISTVNYNNSVRNPNINLISNYAQSGQLK